jgi:hypothetical protein
LTRRFHDATGQKLRYVIGTMWDGGNLAHYSPDQPQVLIDGLPQRAPWIDLNEVRKKGAIVVWTDRRHPSALPRSLRPSRPAPNSARRSICRCAAVPARCMSAGRF